MKEPHLYKKIYLALFLSAFITTCFSQENTSLQKDNAVESKSLPKIVKTLGKGGVVGCAIEDKAGNLWFGTHNEGVFRYDGKSFVKFSE